MKQFVICANGTWEDFQAGSVGQACKMFIDTLNFDEDFIPEKASIYEVVKKNDSFYPLAIKNEKTKREQSKKD